MLTMASNPNLWPAASRGRKFPTMTLLLWRDPDRTGAPHSARHPSRAVGEGRPRDSGQQRVSGYWRFRDAPRRNLSRRRSLQCRRGGHAVELARLVSRVRHVFFLHPEVLPSEGSPFFGAVADNATNVAGARIRSVIIGSPAFKAGIRTGDIIRQFDHETVADAKDLEKTIAMHKPGARVPVQLWRDGSTDYVIARLTHLAEFAMR